jgi:hypothetical protein
MKAKDRPRFDINALRDLAGEKASRAAKTITPAAASFRSTNASQSSRRTPTFSLRRGMRRSTSAASVGFVLHSIYRR